MKSAKTLIAALLVAGLASGAADAACQMTKVATLHVTVEDNKILVPGSINGTPVQFLLATDIESMILSWPAHELGLRRFVGSRFEPVIYVEEITSVPGGPVKVEELVLDGLARKDVVMHVIGRRMDFGKPEQMAVIGRDFLRKFDVEFNLPAGEVNLLHGEGCEDSNLAYWTDRYNVLEMDHRGRIVRVQATIGGKKVIADINSANPYTALNSDAISRLDITPLSGSIQALPPGHDFLADRPIETRQIMVDSFGLDQEVIRPAALRIRKLSVPPPLAQTQAIQDWDTETGYSRPEYDFVTGSRIGIESHSSDLSLGVDFIKAHRMLIAYSQFKVYFSYVPGQAFLSPISPK